MTAEEKWDKLRAHVAARKTQAKIHHNQQVYEADSDYCSGEASGFWSALIEVSSLIQRLDQESS